MIKTGRRDLRKGGGAEHPLGTNNPSFGRILGLLLLGIFIAVGCSREPMPEQADTSRPLMNATPINLDAAVAEAGAKHKIVLLDFTGSDWCPPCMQLHKEIFSQPQFQSYAGSNLVFIPVDFPKKYQLPPNTAATNDLLAAKFNVEAFPTLIALDGEGKEVWRNIGFIEGGPKALIADLAPLATKTK
jgi:thioredoxin-related protein